MSDLIAIPESRDPHSLVEWLEWVMTLEMVDDFSIAEMLSRFPSGQRPPAQDIELALDIVEQRSGLGMQWYPWLRIDDRVVRRSADGIHEPSTRECLYIFLKLACLEGAPWVGSHRASDVGSLFDHPVLEAMICWMGRGSEGLIFGLPVRNGRPGKLTEAVSWLANRIGLPDGDRDRPQEGDGGVDCVVWKAAQDGRSAFPVWLVQDSVEHDIVAKATQTIPIESWKRWIKFGAGPTTVFATAHSIPEGSDAWMKLNDAAVLVVDRNRLLSLLNECDAGDEVKPWLAEICDFVDEQLALMRNPGPEQRLPQVRRRKRERHGPEADPRAR